MLKKQNFMVLGILVCSHLGFMAMKYLEEECCIYSLISADGTPSILIKPKLSELEQEYSTNFQSKNQLRN